MNTQTSILTEQEQQRQNRLIKGQEIYNKDLIAKLEGDIFLVKDKYVVEDISTELTPIFTCSCPDFEYRTDIELCKHIYAVLLYKMDIVNGA